MNQTPLGLVELYWIFLYINNSVSEHPGVWEISDDSDVNENCALQKRTLTDLDASPRGDKFCTVVLQQDSECSSGWTGERKKEKSTTKTNTHRDTHCGTIKKMIPSEPALAFCHNFLYFYYLLAIFAVAWRALRYSSTLLQLSFDSSTMTEPFMYLGI